MNKIHQALNSTKDFVKNHRKLIIGVGVIVAVTAVAITVKAIAGQPCVNTIPLTGGDYIYDSKKGMFFEMTRRMTKQEIEEYLRRLDEGESVEKILRSMKIIRNIK